MEAQAPVGCGVTGSGGGAFASGTAPHLAMPNQAEDSGGLTLEGFGLFHSMLLDGGFAAAGAVAAAGGGVNAQGAGGMDAVAHHQWRWGEANVYDVGDEDDLLAALAMMQ
jgi:hypothetical protein